MDPVRPTLACLAIGLATATFADTSPPEDNPEATRLVAEAEAACAEEGSGALIVSPAAYVPTDLDGDGDEDLVIDFAKVICARDPALFYGTGGSPVAFVLDGEISKTFVGLGWSMAEAPDMADLTGPARVILLRVHGSWCGGYGTSPCLRAITVTGGAFHTMGGALDEL